MDYLAVLQSNGTRIVRAVAKTTGEVSDALFGLVRSERATWTLSEWKIVLKELDKCELTVHAWLEIRNEEWLR
jgi:hypothetical protein